MRIAVSAAVFVFALMIGAKTHWVAVSKAATATAEDRAFAAVVLGQTGPDATSAELIDAAVSRGEISPEYGLLYGVYLACAGDLLPAQYRGQYVAPATHDVLWEPDVDWASLSPDVRGALREFFTANAVGEANSPCAEEIRQRAGQADIWWAAALRSGSEGSDGLTYTASRQ
jgi:hypothetical protein